MGFATHLGAWLLGTVKDTTGTVAQLGQVRNTGVTTVSQTKKVDYTGLTTAGRTDNLFTIPAGAQIVDIKIDTLTAFTGSTAANATMGSAAGSTTAAVPAAYWATSDLTAQGRLAYTGAATKLAAWAGTATTASPNGQGIGPFDVTVTATMTPTVATVTAGLVQYTIHYAVANADGTQAPASA